MGDRVLGKGSAAAAIKADQPLDIEGHATKLQPDAAAINCQDGVLGPGVGEELPFLFTTVSVFAVAFLLAMAAGAPWGAYAMGDAFPGRFPPALRVAALVQATLIVAVAAVVLARAELMLAGWAPVSPWLIWRVVGFAAVSLILNLLTPSVRERRIWAPAALLLLASSTLVAFTAPARSRVESNMIRGGSSALRRSSSGPLWNNMHQRI